jgi:CheY-like chemotaxis protein
MPVMNGGEFCEILRELGINIPFIIISAEDRTAMVEKIGANEALLKPFTPSVILLAVEKWGNYNVADQKEE